MADAGPRLVDGGLPPNVEGTIVTVGTFDGVHRGHQDVLARLAARAAATGLHSLLVTFAGHPLELLRPEVAPLLLTPGQEKLAAIASAGTATRGVDYVAVLPFDRALAALDPGEFVTRILRDRFRMRELFVGHDHGFGRGRAGDAAALAAMGARDGFAVDVIPPVIDAVDGRPLSSTTVREAVAAGDLAHARVTLGRDYAAVGHVVHGDARGRALGFRTLNVSVDAPRKLLPPDGVYAARVETPTGRFDAMLNLGGRPTFGDERRSLEAHLFDADGDWYGAPVRVDFVARLRDVQKFDGVDALVAQLGRDAEAARTALASR